jgi:multiple sugar transport system permease protein
MKPIWRNQVNGHALKRLIGRVIVFILLMDVAFIFLLPVLRLASTAMMDTTDQHDPTVVWLPRHFAKDNFQRSFEALDYWQALRNTTLVSLAAALLQTLSAALVGYGFARLKFPGRDALFLLVLFSLIVPPQTIIIQLFVLYGKLNWLDSYLPFLVPSSLGMGLRGALFIFIFRQFFKGLPWELEDAAYIDGAGPLRVFFNIMLPLAQPAIVVVFLFSFVWHWNDSFEPSIYLTHPDKFFLTQHLSGLEAAMRALRMLMTGNTGIIMAASLLVILPMLILYIFVQRYFVESIERTGLVG